jgi:hypothetical protein
LVVPLAVDPLVVEPLAMVVSSAVVTGSVLVDAQAPSIMLKTARAIRGVFFIFTFSPPVTRECAVTKIEPTSLAEHGI